MSVTKQQMRNAINSYRKSGYKDYEILNALEARKDAVGEAYRAAIASGHSKEAIAKEFGIDTKVPLLDKAKSHAESAYLGIAKPWAGLVQGVAYAGDKINEHIVNPLFGTNLSTNAYEEYTQAVDDVSKEKDRYRKQVGREGMDWTETGASIVSATPKYVLGRSAGTGAKMTTRLGEQGLRGAIDGATSYAKDGKERLINTGLGAIFGAGGEYVGAIGANGAKKAYNVIKGNKTPSAQAIEQLGTKHNVRTSVHDIKGAGVGKNLETQLERVPVVGTSTFRQKQQAEAKAAATKMGDKFRDGLDATDYKYLDEVSKAASKGNKNAQRVLDKVNSATEPDEILQSSLELRMFREKEVGNKMYERVDKLVGSQVHDNVKPTNTKTLLDSRITELESSLAPDDELLSYLKSVVKNIDNPQTIKNWKNMKELRSELGNKAEQMAKKGNNEASAFLGKLKDTVTKDMDAYIAEVGDSNIKTAYNRANKYWSSMLSRQEKIHAKAMNSSTPDQIYKTFVKKGQGDKAKNFYQALDPKGQAALRYQMVEEAINTATDPHTGLFSPAKFAKSFKDIKDPYEEIFSGASKREMDGFVKLMSHIERAGQYMENPPTGVRLADVAMVGGTVAAPATMAKIGSVALVAKALFTTKAGKRLLLAANDLPPNARGFANILETAQKMAGSVGANLATGITNESNNTPQELPSEMLGETEPQPPQTPTEHGSDDATSVIEPSTLPQNTDVSTPEPAVTNPIQAPPMASMMGGNIRMANNEPDGAMIGDEQGQYDGHQEQEISSLDATVGQTLASLIPLPKETNNPKKMQVYQKVVEHRVGAVMNSEPMQMIMGEMSQPEPDEHRLMMFQHMLVKTPQWQQFLQTIPKNQREQMKGIDILAMITQSIHQESNMLAPQF